MDSIRRPRVIGIAGGAGPFAGLDLMRKILEETLADRDQDHLPVLLWSMPAELPDRTEYLIGKEKHNPAGPFTRVLRALEAAGAHVAGIPCNTAHAPLIFHEIRRNLQAEGSALRLLHMIEEVTRFLRSAFPGAAVGVLSTRGTAKAGIYQEALQTAGLRALLPDHAGQERVHQSIYDPGYGVKARSSPVLPEARNILLEEAEKLIRRGAEVLVLGCTEIPLAVPENELNGIPLIDPARVLARALISVVAPEKLRPL